VIWRVFRRASPKPQTDSWWRDAEQAAAAPTAAALDALHARVTHASDDLDEAERQEEMIDGLRQMLTVAETPDLPVIVTQHRVIGADRCYFVAPVSLAGDVAAPGKLFLTADRLIFSSGKVQAWPWHRIQEVARAGRVLSVVLTGGAEGVRVQCNTYGDALVVWHLVGRVGKR
jgi:hypothetical protein